MKYVVLIGDGMADEARPELGNKTLLEAAHTPNMDSMVREGITGTVYTIPSGMAPGSDVANLSILGYDPVRYYRGRAPLEAASIGVELGPDDVAFRCNLVTLETRAGAAIMEDYSAGHITTAEGATLIAGLQGELGSELIRFYPGKSYRHLTVWKGGPEGLHLTPPHDILSRPVDDYLPKGEGSDQLLGLMRRSQQWLKDHPVNRKRKEEGKKSADSIWLWGSGKAPRMPSFKEKYGLEGAVIAAVDLVMGIARCLKLRTIEVPGATGYLDTNYAGKVDYGLEALKGGVDFLYLHVEAPDETGHEGDLEKKLRAIEDFDRLVVGRMLDGLKGVGEHRVLMLPDHYTPLSIRTHTSDPVPFAMFGAGLDAEGEESFCEKLTGRSKRVFKDGYKLMDFFLTL